MVFVSFLTSLAHFASPCPCRLPFQSTLHQRGLVAVRAGNDGNDVEREPEAQSTDGTGNSNEPSRQAVNSKQQTQPSLARGQTTAIITGAISILFGIAYLALVQFMDMRGGELLPPPPEAYLP